MVGLFGLTERIVYKSGLSRAQGFAQLVHHFATIDELRLTEYARWVELSNIVASPAPGDLTRIEDELDAILCAHLAWLWHHHPHRLQVCGSLKDGYIVAPPPPAAAPEPLTNDLPREELPAATFLTAIAVEIEGRPTGFAGGANEQRWKAAVRAAFASTQLGG
jgi:predicted RNase H-like nuclease